MTITPTLTATLYAWNARIANARADYYAHPTASCRRHACERLADGDMLCGHHRRELDEARARRKVCAA